MVINELKAKNRITYTQQETFKNKIKFYSCMDELNDEISKGRTKPSNIKNRKKYGYFYKFIQWFGY